MVHFRLLGALVAVLLGGTTALAETREVRDPGLVPYVVVDGEIPKSLTGKPGDAKRGKALANKRGVGFCPICHLVPVDGEAFYGTIGPDLKGVADRLKEGEMRLRLVNPKMANEATMMPAYYRTGQMHMVEKRWQGKSFMTAEEIEDVVAYLGTLKD